MDYPKEFDNLSTEMLDKTIKCIKSYKGDKGDPFRRRVAQGLHVREVPDTWVKSGCKANKVKFSDKPRNPIQSAWNALRWDLRNGYLELA
jgi:rubredoxin